MEVYLIRHGVTAGNLEKRYVGSTDEALTQEGVLALKRNRRRYPIPAYVYVSPLARCVQTASILFPGVGTEVCGGLRECGFGRFEYRNYRELDGDPEYQAWIDSNGTMPFPGGEDPKSFKERTCRAFLECLGKAAAQDIPAVAFVVHGGTVMAVMERFCLERREYFAWQVTNGEGFWLRAEGEVLEKLAESAWMGGAAPSALLQADAGEGAWPGRGPEEGRLRLALQGSLPLPAESLPRTGVEDLYVMQKNRRLQCGYTTGTCAAAAAKAAAAMLLGGGICRQAELTTPSGAALSLEIEFPKIGADSASCAVRKFAGDDPDATDGLLIFAEVRKLSPEEKGQSAGNGGGSFSGAREAPDGGRTERGEGRTASGSGARETPDGGRTERGEGRTASGSGAREAPDGGRTERGEGRTASGSGAWETPDRGSILPGDNEIRIEGGPGVGRVTRPGLEQPVGAAAINRVPRQMIRSGLQEVCRDYGCGDSLSVVISVPGGAETAEKTFNPRLGIEGGISILGTSGIVVPMSEQALIESIRVEMRQRVENGERYLLVTPGNYGADFLKNQEQYRRLCPDFSMKCSNYVGETLDMAVEMGVQGILFVAHIGKFIKVSGGIMNTHSSQGDCRAELIAAQAMRAGADAGTVRQLLDTNTTEEAVEVLRVAGCLPETIRETAEHIRSHLQKRCQGACQTEAILFSSRYGFLGQTSGAEELMGRLAEEKRRLGQQN